MLAFWGEGLCLHSQEGQDLCACAAAEELIFNTSSQHQTVDLSNKCMTKDFLRDFRHACTVHGRQEDRTFDMQLPVDTWRCIPLMIHVRVCAQRSSVTKTQGNLVCPGFSKPRTDDGTKALIFRVGDLVVMQKRCLRTHGSWDIWSFVAHTSNTRTDTVRIRFFCFLAESTQLHFWGLCRT